MRGRKKREEEIEAQGRAGSDGRMETVRKEEQRGSEDGEKMNYG